MSSTKVLSGLLVVSLLLAGCSLTTATQTAPPPAPATPVKTLILTPPIPSVLALDALKNMTCQLPASERTVTFVNGRYSDTSAGQSA